MSRGWKPILQGETARAARTVASEIADALVGYGAEDDTREPVGEYAQPFGPALSGGHAGLALMFAYLDEHLPERGYQDAAMDALGRALEGVEEVLPSVGLYAGFPGICWAVAHLEIEVWKSGDLDDLEPLDNALLELLASPWQWGYDLISGLVGMGVYALERPDSETMGRVLERLLWQLENCSEASADGHGVTWRTPPEQLPEHQRAVAPQGYHNLGLAHGVPGVIALLARMVSRGGDVAERSRALLRQAMDWFIARIAPPDHPSGTRSWLAIGQPLGGKAQTRAAWCYGDPGAALALMQGARALGDADMEAHALALGLRSARRPVEDCGVVDAGICHGAVGVAHVFNRLYQGTGEDDFARAATYWFEKTLAMRKPGAGLAGYLALENDIRTGQMGWIPSPGLLIGAAGIALALSAASSEIAPEWDRFLLCALECV